MKAATLKNLSLVCLAASIATAQASKETVRGQSQTTTSQVQGTVIYREGNIIVVETPKGEWKEYQVDPTRKFLIDGKELTVGQLKKGTKLTATTTTTTTPLTERTTTIGNGKVWYVGRDHVILTLPSGENKLYQVDDRFKFNVEGHDATIHELRKGMTVSATRIVEEPKTEIVENTVVTGTTH
jgi:hypothetical protein